MSGLERAFGSFSTRSAGAYASQIRVFFTRRVNNQRFVTRLSAASTSARIKRVPRTERRFPAISGVAASLEEQNHPPSRRSKFPSHLPRLAQSGPGGGILNICADRDQLSRRLAASLS
jgi:hypothetical protein